MAGNVNILKKNSARSAGGALMTSPKRLSGARSRGVQRVGVNNNMASAMDAKRAVTGGVLTTGYNSGILPGTGASSRLMDSAKAVSEQNAVANDIYASLGLTAGTGASGSVASTTVVSNNANAPITPGNVTNNNNKRRPVNANQPIGKINIPGGQRVKEVLSSLTEHQLRQITAICPDLTDVFDILFANINVLDASTGPSNALLRDKFRKIIENLTRMFYVIKTMPQGVQESYNRLKVLSLKHDPTPYVTDVTTINDLKIVLSHLKDNRLTTPAQDAEWFLDAYGTVFNLGTVSSTIDQNDPIVKKVKELVENLRANANAYASLYLNTTSVLDKLVSCLSNSKQGDIPDYARELEVELRQDSAPELYGLTNWKKIESILDFLKDPKVKDIIENVMGISKDKLARCLGSKYSTEVSVDDARALLSQVKILDTRVSLYVEDRAKIEAFARSIESNNTDEMTVAAIELQKAIQENPSAAKELRTNEQLKTLFSRITSRGIYVSTNSVLNRSSESKYGLSYTAIQNMCRFIDAKLIPRMYQEEVKVFEDFEKATKEQNGEKVIEKAMELTPIIKRLADSDLKDLIKDLDLITKQARTLGRRFGGARLNAYQTGAVGAVTAGAISAGAGRNVARVGASTTARVGVGTGQMTGGAVTGAYSAPNSNRADELLRRIATDLYNEVNRNGISADIEIARDLQDKLFSACGRLDNQTELTYAVQDMSDLYRLAVGNTTSLPVDQDIENFEKEIGSRYMNGSIYQIVTGKASNIPYNGGYDNRYSNTNNSYSNDNIDIVRVTNIVKSYYDSKPPITMNTDYALSDLLRSCEDRNIPEIKTNYNKLQETAKLNRDTLNAQFVADIENALGLSNNYGTYGSSNPSAEPQDGIAFLASYGVNIG